MHTLRSLEIGKEAGMIQFENLRTVQQVVDASRPVAEAEPTITEGSLRWLIFNAEENGLDQALVRVGRRVLIDVDAFNAWLESRRARSA